MTLSTPVSQITSVGKRIAPALKKLGLETARDLLFYWPFRYEDWSRVEAIEQVQPGENVTIKGEVELIQNKRSRWQKRMVTEGIIADDTGKIRAVWFHQPYLIRNLQPGDTVYISGKADLGPGGLQITHPTYEKITRQKGEPTHTARIVPVYSLTARVTQKQLRYVISQVLPLAQLIPEWLPKDIITHHALLSFSDAITQIHFPESLEQRDHAAHRLKFNELLLINLRAQMLKSQLKQAVAPTVAFHESLTQDFVSNLPFTLTDAQRKVAWEIIGDLQRPVPMNRLLEGDVGSGKTIVSALPILNTLQSGFQVAYMTPTEILATQQYHSFVNLFSSYDFTIALLTGNQVEIVKTQKHKNTKTLTKKHLTQMIQQGDVDMVIGTHALIQKSVEFNNLALAIIDEQHRFGVSQRAALVRESNHTHASSQAPLAPHFLSMTATPIPRSLALTLYGDLDLSIIDEMPRNRKPIETKLVPPEKRGEFYSFIQNEVGNGRQVFVICPLIDPSDKLGKKAVTEEFHKLDRDVFPDLRIGLLHGKLKPADKESVMRAFANHELDILVATPVIEVGIDIPNASVMMIESAERFGLAQLHQFRGRVGRGEHQSYCFLFTESESRPTLDRLQALVDSRDGFELAERDLDFRGPGEVYGVRQHGFDDVLRIAKLTDYHIIKQAQETTAALLNASPDLSKIPLVKQRLEEFEMSIHLE